MLHLSNEWRIGDDVSQLYYFYLQGTALFKMSNWAKVGPGYRQIWHLRETRWRHDCQPFIDLFFEKDKGNGQIQFRNRFAYIIREASFDTWQYRGRLRFMGSWMVGERFFSPYLSDEVFLDDPYGFTQNRLMTGIVLPILNSLNADVYYMLRHLKNRGHWTHQHVIGTWINIHF